MSSDDSDLSYKHSGRRCLMLVAVMFLVLCIIFASLKKWDVVIGVGVVSAIFLGFTIYVFYRSHGCSHEEPIEYNPQHSLWHRLQVIESRQASQNDLPERPNPSGVVVIERNSVILQELDARSLGIPSSANQRPDNMAVAYDPPPAYNTVDSARNSPSRVPLTLAPSGQSLAPSGQPLASSGQPLAPSEDAPRVFMPSSDGLPSYEVAIATRRTGTNGSSASTQQTTKF